MLQNFPAEKIRPTCQRRDLFELGYNKPISAESKLIIEIM
jgi:hypothetical protein